MAGISSRQIRRRMKSVQSTMQITKAMELVASSKLSQTRATAEATQPYFQILYETILDITERNREYFSVYLQPREVKKRCFLVIAGDRGLAGGYNNNVLTLAEQTIGEQPHCVVPMGAKAHEYFEYHESEILYPDFPMVEAVEIKDCIQLAHRLTEGFKQGVFDELVIVYTSFASILEQHPITMQMLPLPNGSSGKERSYETMILYEPSSEFVYEKIVPQYLTGLIYGAVCESRLSEVAARRIAMESASNNASDLLEYLQLEYNRTRQSAITQEISEIVSGRGY